jgi:phenylacetate-CoA ligase
MIDVELSDAELYPTLTEHGRRMLEWMREHPHAPIYRNRSGNRLTAAQVEQARAFERETLAATFAWRPGAQPPWLDDFVARCFAEVPFYQRLGAPPRFDDLPSISRADFSRDVAPFVPDSVPVHELINFRTTGTTGHPLVLASHPLVAAGYLAFHKRALRRLGIEPRHGRGQVGVVLLGMQRRCFTYVSVTPTMGESGLAKINLHPDDWRDPADRARYLDALAPELYAGDPLSWAELLTLPLVTRPRALLSTSMALGAGLRARLEERFGCPVLDLYSLNEAGPVAVADSQAGGHVLLQPNLYVEILDPDDRPVRPGVRGEVTLTGGFNFCLPLLRYRTGDHAALGSFGDEPVLIELQGRAPIRFRTAAGLWINNIDVTHALAPLPLVQFALHQAADGALALRYQGALVDPAALRRALETLFGTLPLAVAAEAAFDGKAVQYSSELAGASP